MERLDHVVSTIGAFLGTGFTFIFGGWETGVQILFICMIMDFVLGIMCGTKEHALSSEKGFKGLKKNTKYKFAVKAYKTDGKNTVFADKCTILNIKTSK